MVSVDGELEIHNLSLELDWLERFRGHHGRERKRNKLSRESGLGLSASGAII